MRLGVPPEMTVFSFLVCLFANVFNVGILAWISLNFLTGKYCTHIKYLNCTVYPNLTLKLTWYLVIDPGSKIQTEYIKL